MGFDAYKEEYVNMVDAGILDPAKGYQKRSAERNQRCFYLPDYRVRSSKHQRAGSGSSRRCSWRNGNDVIPAIKNKQSEDRRPCGGGFLFIISL